MQRWTPLIFVPSRPGPKLFSFRAWAGDLKSDNGQPGDTWTWGSRVLRRWPKNVFFAIGVKRFFSGGHFEHAGGSRYSFSGVFAGWVSIQPHYKSSQQGILPGSPTAAFFHHFTPETSDSD